jgi:hypothetical protein
MLSQYDQKIIEKLDIPNRNIFQEINISTTKLNFDNLAFNVFDAIELEVNFIKKTYINLLYQIRENIDESELNSWLIKFSFQKIYYFISLLKKKKVCLCLD